MKYHLRIFISTILISIAAGLSSMGAQQLSFLSKSLENIAHNIHLTIPDTLHIGSNEIGSAFDMPIIAEVDGQNTVTHLGFKLFPDKLKDSETSYIYKFLERYFLELYSWKGATNIQQKINDDNFVFVEGSLEAVKHLSDTLSLSVSRVDNKFYEVSFASDSETILSVAFPAQYELILGMPKAEIEQCLYDIIVSAIADDEHSVSTLSVEQIDDNLYKTNPVSSFQLESLNNACYYRKDSADASYSLIVDEDDLPHSVTNVFHHLTHITNPMRVEQSIYGFNKRSYTIKLDDWVNYCLSAKMNVYTAIEEEFDDSFKVLVVAESSTLGFCHVLSVILPRNFLSKATSELRCKLNAFIPLHNVKNLYQQAEQSKKKHIE